MQVHTLDKLWHRKKIVLAGDLVGGPGAREEAATGILGWMMRIWTRNRVKK